MVELANDGKQTYSFVRIPGYNRKQFASIAIGAAFTSIRRLRQNPVPREGIRTLLFRRKHIFAIGGMIDAFKSKAALRAALEFDGVMLPNRHGTLGFRPSNNFERYDLADDTWVVERYDCLDGDCEWKSIRLLNFTPSFPLTLLFESSYSRIFFTDRKHFAFMQEGGKVEAESQELNFHSSQNYIECAASRCYKGVMYNVSTSGQFYCFKFKPHPGTAIVRTLHCFAPST